MMDPVFFQMLPMSRQRPSSSHDLAMPKKNFRRLPNGMNSTMSDKEDVVIFMKHFMIDEAMHMDS